jgi:hypothetical protein
MSLRPAVLYDHVPTAIPDDDDEDDEDRNKETLGVSYYVSKMVHRVSAPLAPRQEKDNNNICGVQQFQVLEGEQGDDDDKNGSDHYGKVRNEIIGQKDDDDHHHDKHESESDDDDDDIRPMETIIEDTDSDYILIPIPSSAAMMMTTTNGDNNDQVILSTTHRRTIHRLRKQLLARCTLIFKNTNAAIASLESNNRHNSQIWDFWKAKIRATITKPISYYLRNLKSSSIYSSYDWVSETVIDIHGNRLILPGACVDLDVESENSIMIDDDNNSNNSINSNNNNDTGTLIVPACTDSVTLKQDDDFGTRSNSPLSSTTIMVSAYDLLSVERNNQQTKRRINNNNTDTQQSLSLFETIEEDHHGGSRDYRYYYRDDDDDDDFDGNNVEDYQSTMIMIATPKDITQQWKHTIWKLVKRKTNKWYCGGYFRFQQTIQCVGRLLIDSQQLLLNYNCSSSNRIHRRALLLLLSNSNANSNKKGVLLETNDRDKTDKQEVPASTIFDSTKSSQYTTTATTIKDDEGAVIIEMTSCKSNICIRTLHHNEQHEIRRMSDVMY